MPPTCPPRGSAALPQTHPCAQLSVIRERREGCARGPIAIGCVMKRLSLPGEELPPRSSLNKSFLRIGVSPPSCVAVGEDGAGGSRSLPAPPPREAPFARLQRSRWAQPRSSLAAPHGERKETREEKEHKRDVGPWKDKSKKIKLNAIQSMSGCLLVVLGESFESPTPSAPKRWFVP